MSAANEALQAEIAHREQIERELRESETRFRATFEQAAVGIAHVGLDGRFLRVNEKLCAILGYSREKLLQGTFQEISFPGDLDGSLDVLQKLKSGEIDSASFEKRYVRPDHSILWAQVTVATVREEGRPAWLISVIEDIGARKNAEEQLRCVSAGLEIRVQERTAELMKEIAQREHVQAALRESHQLLKAIFDGTTDSIFLRDLDGVYTMINSAGARLLGRKIEDVVGRHLGEIFPPMIAEEILAQDRAVLAANETHTFEIALPTARGPGRFLATRGPHFDACGRVIGTFGITRDITELRRMERAIAEISDREQQRIGQDLHDGVCQRLAGIGLLAGVLKTKLQNGGREEVVAQVDEIAKLLEQTTAEVRAIARGLFPMHPGPHGLMTALYELAGSTQRLFKVSCELRCEEPVFVEDSTAAAHLYRIAQEAVNNAVKHSGCKRIEIVLDENDDAVLLSIHDDGGGVRADMPGRGLGMHIMNYRAGLIGGKIEVRSDSQSGTTVIGSAAHKKVPPK